MAGTGNEKSSTGRRLAASVVLAAIFVVFYMLWTHSTDPGDLAIISVAGLVVSFLFVRPWFFPPFSIKRIGYAAVYIPYLFVEIMKANLDVASRIVRRRIPLNPGIVAVDTRLRTPLGRTVLANSITLTPGTLSVEIKGDRLYIHWIDVKDRGSEEAARRIISGFEKYLEVIFG